MRTSRIHVALALGLAVLVPRCGRNRPQEGADSRPPFAVSVTEATRAPWQGLLFASGTVIARSTTSIASRVPGTVREVRVRAGDRAARGTLLVWLDAAETVDQAKAATAGARAAESAAEEAERGLEAAEAEAAVGAATYERLRMLAAREAATAQELDDARARNLAAQARRDGARARVAAARAALVAARAGSSAAETGADYLRIKAPFDGLVVDRLVDPGAVVGPGSPLLVFADESAYEVEAQVGESHAGGVKAGTRATISIGERKLPASTYEVVPAVDPATRTFRARLKLAGDPKDLRPGLFARVAFDAPAQDRLVVPASAVRHQGGLDLVFAVADGHAHARLVTTGESHDGRVEILSGLAPGTRIVASAPQELADGSPVTERP